MDSIHEKNRGRKSRDTAPLSEGQFIKQLRIWSIFSDPAFQINLDHFLYKLIV